MPRMSTSYRTLILPNIAALSTAQCDQLRQFVERGGSLIATHETSLYDEWGVRRNDFGLAELFGASFDGGIEGPMQNSYLTSKRIRHRSVPSTAARARRRQADHQRREPGEDQTRPRPGYLAADVGTLLSRPADGRSLRPRPANRYPRRLRARSGRGRVVYFPLDVDRTFWEVLDADHAACSEERCRVGNQRRANRWR